MNNYRPISVISAIAKVFERIVYNQLSSYLSVNNILSQHQSGFRSFHSTVTALLEATDNWAFNIDRGYVNAVVILDLNYGKCENYGNSRRLDHPKSAGLQAR